MLAQLSLIAGDKPSREATSPSRREKRKAGLEKACALWARRPSLDGHIRRRATALRVLAK